MRRRTFAALVLGVALAGCTVGYGQRLDPSLVESFKLQQVDVVVPETATFYWGDGERAYARSINRPESESQTLGATPGGHAFMQAEAAQRIKTAFDAELRGKFTGTRPVRVQVTMQDVYVSSPLQNILIGGDYHMAAGVTLVDAKTGEVIAANSGLRTRAPTGNGLVGAAIDHAIGDPFDRLANQLAGSYRDWLFPSSAPPRT